MKVVGEATTKRTVGGIEWTVALLQADDSSYWCGVHTSSGADSWDSQPVQLNATDREAAWEEARAQLLLLIRACVGEVA